MGCEALRPISYGMKPNIGQGDDGKTRLLGAKEKCNKDDPQVEAYGTLDELNSIVGIIRAQEIPQEVAEALMRVQEDLFCAEAHAAASREFDLHSKLPQFDETRIQFLENHIRKWENRLPPLSHFILPGGIEAAAFCDLARTMARRAERRLAAWQRNAAQTPARHFVYQYVNRLSDFFFTLERYLNFQANKTEKLWKMK